MRAFLCIKGLLLLICICSSGFAQRQNLRFEHLSVRHGLSNSSVSSILQDREGYMWFGTPSGLNKYDGYTFTGFNPDPKDPSHSLLDDHIYDIHEDRIGRLWIGAYGLNLMDKRTGQVKAYLADSTSFTYLNISCTIYEDKVGKLWTSSGGGLNSFDPASKQFTSYRSPELVPNFGIVEDGGGTFWMGSAVGLYQFDSKTGRFKPFLLNRNSSVQPSITALLLDEEEVLWIGTANHGLFVLNTKSNSDYANPYNPGQQMNSGINRNGIVEGSGGNLWIATTEGLQKINKRAHEITTYKANPMLPGFLSSNNVLSVYEDKKGTLWVGTSNGINKATIYSRQFSAHQVAYPAQSIRLWENVITKILEDKEETVWLGTGKGLYRFDPKSDQITYVPINNSKNSLVAINNSSGSEITVIHEDYLGRLWVGTAAGLFLLNPSSGTFKHYPCKIRVNTLDEDAFGKLWIPGGDQASGRAVMAVFDLKELEYSYTEYPLNNPTGLKDMYLNGIMVGSTGDIWVATQSWGISRMDQKTGKFNYYLPDSITRGNLNGRFIVTLYEDNDGIIWAGTKMSGLYKLDPKTGAFNCFTTYDGLPSNKVVSIAGDKNGNLWIGTNKGLSQFNPKTQSFRNFDMTDGLPGDEFILGSVFASKKKMFFGTANGFTIFLPDSMNQNKWPPLVYLTNLKVLEKNRPVPDSVLELPYDENFLSFDYVAINYDVPEKNQYAYRLIGLDREWISAGTRRYAIYPGLSPGTYTFRVKASNNDGIWNEKGASLTIIIHPPWWKTWWFYSLCMVAIIAILYSLYYIRVSRLKELLQVRNKIARDLHDDVGSTLSSISIMTEMAKQKLPQSSSLLEKIGTNAQQMQENMSDIVWAINPKNDRLEDVLRRMKMFASEMLETKNITLHFRADQRLNDVKLTMTQRRNVYFIFKEAITNLARYSASKNATVIISYIHKSVELLIQDDGKGFDANYQTMGGNGLYNMQKRADDLHGSFIIDSIKGKGTTVSLHFKTT